MKRYSLNFLFLFLFNLSIYANFSISSGNGVSYNTKGECFLFSSLENAAITFSSEEIELNDCKWYKINFNDSSIDTTDISSSDFSLSADNKSVTLKISNTNVGYLIEYGDNSCNGTQKCSAFTWVTNFQTLENVSWPKDTIICSDLELSISPVMFYYTQYGNKKEIDRNLSISYMSYINDNNEPTEGTVNAEYSASDAFTLDQMPYLNTTFEVKDLTAKSLGINTTITTDTFFTQAVIAYPEMITSSDFEHEGDEGTDSLIYFNESFESALSESSKFRSSGPLTINFFSHSNFMTNHYEWAIANGTAAQQGDFENAFVLFEQDVNSYVVSDPGLYCIELTVSNIRNDSICKNSSYACFNIAESQLYVPNAFTPNGDGINDEFRVGYRSIESFECWIYDQWGRKVYESSDITKGWDGYVGSKIGALGAYYYVIKAVGTDGIKYTKKGAVNLLRSK